jgi:4-amino-4-deoxy-L-arabinose transferase-like glycosyltransferase
MLKSIKSWLSSQPFWIVIVSLFSLSGTIVVLYSTVWGAVLSDDSYHYISSARNLIAGRGFDLIPHFAPVLPLLLSVGGLFKVDPLAAVRWVNAVLFGLNIFLVAWIVRSQTNSPVFSLLGALLTLVVNTLIMVHSGAMSEALYISLLLIGFLVVASTYQKGSRGIPLATGLCFGLAATTRYIGVSLLMAGGIFWLTEAGKSSRERLRNAFWFSAVGVIPLLLWIIRNQTLTGRPTSRIFSWHPISRGLWINALNTMFVWLSPGRFVHGKELAWLGGIGLVLFTWLGVVIFRDRHGLIRLGQSLYRCKLAFLICLGILAYWAVLIISRSFFDDRIPMDERLLSPFLVMGLILLVWSFARVWNRSRWLGRSIVVVVSLMLLMVNLTRSVQMVQSYHQLGRGYSSARDHISETYAYLRNRPNTPIYSNAYAAIYFWTGRVTDPLPSREGIPVMKADMRQTGAYLVVFDSISLELYGVTEKELTEGLVTEIRLSEATIYRSP